MELTIEQALQQGVAAHEEGKLQDAERLYRAILQSQPAHPDANHNLGVLAVSVNKADIALPLFKAALEANPKIEQFWLSYINALIENKQFENAKKVLEQGRNQGVARDKINALEAQVTTTSQVIEPKLVVQKKSLSFSEKRKKSAEEKKKKKTKKQNLKAISPSDLEINNLLQHYQDGKYGDAEKLAVYMTQEFPKNHFGWSILSSVLRKIDRVSESLIACKMAVQLAPQDANIHYNLGNIFGELGKFDESETSYKRAITLKPNFAEAHSNLGNILKNLGRLDKAEASYTKAIALNPCLEEAHYSLGNMLKKRRKLEEAKACYKKAIVSNPDYAEAYNNLSTILQEQGRFDEAEECVRQATVLKPSYAAAHNNLGLYLNALGIRESALEHFKICLDLERGFKPIDPKHKSFISTSKAKIDHDIEQFEYLAGSGYDIKKFNNLADVYRTVASEMNFSSDTEVVPLSNKHRALLGDTYNRPFHLLEAPLLDEPTVGKNQNVNKITEDYFSHEFGLTYIDEFLSPTTLVSLRNFLLGSTIWFDFSFVGGYMGATLKGGLASPLILQIAEELRLKFPKIFKHHKLTQLWAFKYDSRARDKTFFNGIGAHADFAAVNVNFWITPNSANLNKSSGGLVVYNTDAPLEWDFETYNSNKERIREEINKNGGIKKVIPYNENRAVIFNSNLFHETDSIDFKDGYENRRINVTMLFGQRES